MARKIIDYTDETDEEKDVIIAEQKALGFELIEDQRHIDGNHLIFDDEPHKDLATVIDEIKAEQAEIRAKLEEKGII